MATCLLSATLFGLTLACAGVAGGQVITEADVERALRERAEAQEAAKAAQQAQLEARTQQYVRMMQPMMWRELEFIRQACDLTPEQRPLIKAAATNSVLQAAKRMVTPIANGRPVTAASTHQGIRSDLKNVLSEILAPDQLARFTAEAALRETGMRKTAIQSVVAQLDGVLLFGPEQRDALTQSLTTNWKDDWEQWLILWRYDGRYFPQIPDQFIVPHLTDDQRAVWSDLLKIKVNAWGGQTEHDAADDEWWDGKTDTVTTTPKSAAGNTNP